MSKATIALVTLAALNLKAGTQFRASLDDEAVKDYTARLQEWKLANTTKEVEEGGKKTRVNIDPAPPMSEWTKCPLPAITVFETDADGTINADGFHRVKAAIKAGLEQFPAEAKKGTKEDAVRFALQANAGHGVRLTNADKANKLKAALKFPDLSTLSNNALAGKLGVSEFFVRTNRPAGAAPKVVKTAAGKTMNTGNVGKKGGNTAKKKAAADKAKKAADKKAKANGTTPAATTDGATSEEDALAAALGGEGAHIVMNGEASTETASDVKKFDDETEKALARVLAAVSALTDVSALEAAIRNSTVEISTRDLRTLAQTSPERIALAYPLVFGEKRMKPAAAFAFLDKVPDSDTKLGHLFNLTVARRGIVSEKAEGFRVLVVPDNENFTVLTNASLGGFLIVPTDKKDAFLAAVKEM